MRVRQRLFSKLKPIVLLMTVFALIMQPVYSVATAEMASALSGDITQVAFTNAAPTVGVSNEASLSVQLRNAGGTAEQTSSAGSKLKLTSSSATGLFADGAASTDWIATPNYSYNKNTANKSFRYKDTTPGTHTITVKVSGGGVGEVVATQVVTVTAAPAVSLTLAQRIAAANAGDVIDVTSDETVTGNIVINKALTLTSSNGSTISTNGGGDLFRITAPGVTVSNLHFVKTDSVNQHIISVGANTTTISGNSFTGQYVLGGGEVTRALELSPSTTGYVISGNTFTHLRQPAYINDNSTGQITNNYVSDTRGWVVVANTSFTFTGNTFGNNATDIAIISGSPNNYTCDVMRLMLQNNDEPTIDNQVLPIDSCDSTAPSVPTGGQPHNTTLATNSFDYTWETSTDNSEGAVTYQFRSSQDASGLDGASVTEVNNPSLHSTGAGDGVRYWQVRAIDESGNKSGWSDVWNVRIDTIFPTLQLTTPDENEVFGRNNGKEKVVVTAELEDEQGLSQYHIAIDDPDTSTVMGETSEEATVSSAKLKIITIFNAADFTNGMHTIYVWVTDKAGNKTQVSRVIWINNDAPFGGSGAVKGDTGELDRISSQLNQPFVVPNTFGAVVTPSVFTAPVDTGVLGAQIDGSDDKDKKTVAAVPTESGWKLFGIMWYWWVLLAAALAAVSTWLIAMAKRRAANTQ